MEHKQKLKNLKDLEFSRTLNLENIFIVLVGGAIVTTLLSKDLTNKLGLIILLSAAMGTGFSQFNRKLNNIKEEIRSL